MATYEIPLDSFDPAFRFFSDLDGETYRFYFRWIGRTELWVFDVLDNEGNMIQSGNPLHVGIELLRQNRNQKRWPGALIAISGNGEAPSRFNLGSEIQLFYTEAEDL